LTRAYFTAATRANSLLNPLSVNTPPKFFPIIDPAITGNLTYTSKLGAGLRPSSHVSKNKSKSYNIVSKSYRDSILLHPYYRSIFIGLILSDGWIQKRVHWNPRIGFKQSFIHFEFFWATYTVLKNFCSSTPYLCSNYKRGKLFYACEMQTRQLKCLNFIYDLFYDNGKRCIKPDLIHYIDYVVLAYWIMGDGAKRNKGIVLCTQGFSFPEVVTLMNILKIKFDINSTIHFDKQKPTIHINQTNLYKILPYITPYFVDSMKYKIHL